MSFFDDGSLDILSAGNGCTRPDLENDPNFLLSDELNWASFSGSNMPSEDCVDTPRQDTFQQSLFSNHYSPVRTVASTPANNFSDEMSDRDAPKPDVANLSSSPNISASGPELGSSPQYLPGVSSARGSEIAGDASSNDTSPVDPNYFRQLENHCNARISHPGQPYGGNTEDATAIKAEKYVFSLGDSTQRSAKHQASIPHRAPISSSARRPGLKDTLTRPVNPSIAFPSLETLLDPIGRNADMDTFFSSLDEANAATSSIDDVVHDPTLPRTVNQKRAIVKALFNAISSTGRAEDNPGMVKPFAERKYPDVRIEMTCWNLLEASISRHTSGPLLALYLPKTKQAGDFFTFGDRICKMLECLATQKTICKHLLDPYYLYSFVDDPLGARKRVLANKSLNKRKGLVMNAGKQALGGVKDENGRSPAENEQDDPFGSATPSSNTISGIMSDADFRTTPGTMSQQAMKSLNLGSNSLGSSPITENQSMQSSPQGSILGTSSFDASPNLRHGVSPYDSSPIMSYSPMAFLPHLYARTQTHRMVPPNSAPTLTPPTRVPVGVPSMSTPITHSHVRAGSAASSSMNPGSLNDHRLRERVMAPQTPTRRSKATGSRAATSTRRKRTSAEVDAVEYSSPEKKAQF